MIGQTTPSPESPAGTQLPENADLPPGDEAKAGHDGKKEIGGRGGLEPTRYGDWEKNGRCIDF